MKRAVTNEQIILRKQEIINEVSNMFDSMDYQDISMKTISERISISRSSLYCYYNCKEEIMLEIIKNDYLLFIDELTKAIKAKCDLASTITDIYLSHTKLLHIISTYLTDIETHVSVESLIEFKSHFAIPFKCLEETFYNTFTNTSKDEIRTIIDALFMLTHGLYPMIHPNDVQVKAMESVNMYYSIDQHQYCYNYLKLLFYNLK